LRRNREQALYHREIQTTRESYLWVRNAFRYWLRRAADFQTISHLLEHHDRRYFLVPLQVASDSQMSHAACGWTNGRLISGVLSSFARTAPPSCRLVVKIHPLERGHTDARRTVRASAESLGLAGRVDVLETGSAGLLVRHAAGVITINSTTGLSAIVHGVPLLVVGKALYSHPALACCAHGEPDFDGFWTGGPVADPELRRSYLDWIRQEALLPGDFYAPEGIALACAGILTRLQKSPVALRQMIQSTESVPVAASAVVTDLALAGLLPKAVT
jgi:capsular polysaccharide export protein